MKKKNSGFTFVEVVVSTAIVVALAAVLFQLLTSGQMFGGGSEARMDAQERVRLALVFIMRDVRDAAATTVRIRNSDGSNPAYVGGFFNGDTIRFEKPCIRSDTATEIVQLDADGCVVTGAQDSNGVYTEGLVIEYTLDTNNSQIVRRVWDGATEESQTVLMGNIVGLTFRAYQQTRPRQVEVTVVGRGWDSSGRQELRSSAASEILFRN